MGKDPTQNKTGLYGYKDGINTFALTEDGKAIFGGKQQITIDGDNAQITGKNGVTDNQRFLEINLADPNIKDENGNDTGKAADAIKIGSSISDPNFLVDYDGNLKCTNANISGTINATAGKIGDCNIEDGTLKIAEANISNKLSANVIDVDNLNVKSANIANSVNTGWVYAGNITAEQISGGTINGNVVYAGTISAGNISGGTLDFSKLGAAGTAAIQGLTWNMIQTSSGGTGQTIGSDSSHLDKLYVDDITCNDLQCPKVMLSGATSTWISGTGIQLVRDGPYYHWSDIVGGTVKAVFGA